MARIRLAQPTAEDLTALGGLYEQYLEDQAEQGALTYPQHGPQPVTDFLAYVALNMVQNPSWFCVAAVAGGRVDAQRITHGGRIKAAIMGYVTRRPMGYPQVVGFCEMLAVDPKFRRHGIGRKLVAVFARELLKRGAQVLECGWKPGTYAERMWLAMGCLPFTVHGAFVLPDGTVREGLPLVPSGVASSASPSTDVPPMAP